MMVAMRKENLKGYDYNDKVTAICLYSIEDELIMDTLVVIIGVPSAGKTRGSFHICSNLKDKNINVEYVPEFAEKK